MELVKVKEAFSVAQIELVKVKEANSTLRG